MVCAHVIGKFAVCLISLCSLIEPVQTLHDAETVRPVEEPDELGGVFSMSVYALHFAHARLAENGRVDMESLGCGPLSESAGQSHAHCGAGRANGRQGKVNQKSNVRARLTPQARRMDKKIRARLVRSLPFLSIPKLEEAVVYLTSCPLLFY